MARPHAAKALPSKRLLVLAAVALLGVILVADFLWASSSSSSSPGWTARLDFSTRATTPLPATPPPKKQKKDNKSLGSMDINATFAYLPAPELEWEEMAGAPVPLLDGAAIQIKNLLYAFAGYGTINHVHSHVDIFNFSDNTWGGRFDMPKEMAHSHLGMVTDGRFIYVVTGQYGHQCRGPTARNFVLDTKTKRWHDLLPLPVPTYAPTTQLWRGRLHVMGGSKEDRHEPGLEHWSLAVKDGKALEKELRSEIPIPRGGPHRAYVVANDKLLAIGGQEGDFMAKPGSAIFKCVRRSEVVYSNVFMLDDGTEWKELPSMPKPDSHIEFAWVIVNNSIIIAGGTTEKHPIPKKMVLFGELFRFNLGTMASNIPCLSFIISAWFDSSEGGDNNWRLLISFGALMLEWTVIGRLPFRIKTTLVGFWDRWLYFTSGQRDKGPNDPSPKKVVRCMWRTKLHL